MNERAIVVSVIPVRLFPRTNPELRITIGETIVTPQMMTTCLLMNLMELFLSEVRFLHCEASITINITQSKMVITMTGGSKPA